MKINVIPMRGSMMTIEEFSLLTRNTALTWIY